MAERSLISLMAAGLRVKAPTGVTTMNGPLREISGVGFPREPFSGAWQRNISIQGAGDLLTFSPVYACVSRIAADISKLDIELLEEDEDEIPMRASSASPFWTVIKRPNSYQTLKQFVQYWLLCKLIWGNAYAIKMRDQRGMVTALYLIDPRRVQPLVTPDGGVYYGIGGDQLSRIPNGIAAAPASEVIHDRGPTLWHPLVGVPPLYAAARSGTLGLQIQKNSIAFFSNMSRPSGVLTAPGTIEETTAERLKREWNENFAAGGLGKLAVLGDGLEYEAMSMAAEQSQLAQQLGMTAVDVATAFSMPAYKINQGQMPTNNNVEALNQQYYSDCLQVHIESIEECLDDGLGLPERLCIEFCLEGLMRMDSLTQMDVLAKGTKNGLLKPNEGRKRLRLPPVKGGDTLYMQQQDFSIEALAKRDAKDDPFAKGDSAPPAPAPTPAPAAADPADDAAVRALADLVTRAEAAAVDLPGRLDGAAQRAAEAVAAEGTAAAARVKEAADAAAATVQAAADAAQQQADAVGKAAASLQQFIERIETRAAEPAPAPVSRTDDEDEDDVAAFAARLIAALGEANASA